MVNRREETTGNTVEATVCCICGANPEKPVTTSLARKLPFAHTTQDVQFGKADPLVGPMKHRVYTTCPGKCEMKIEHAAGWHENEEKDGCEECGIHVALYEIRQLSQEAKNLILHRLRNPLAIASGNLQLFLDTHLPVDPPSRVFQEAHYVGTAQAAADRLSREITELFG